MRTFHEKIANPIALIKINRDWTLFTTRFIVKTKFVKTIQVWDELHVEPLSPIAATSDLRERGVLGVARPRPLATRFRTRHASHTAPPHLEFEVMTKEHPITRRIDLSYHRHIVSVRNGRPRCCSIRTTPRPCPAAHAPRAPLPHLEFWVKTQVHPITRRIDLSHRRHVGSGRNGRPRSCSIRTTPRPQVPRGAQRIARNAEVCRGAQRRQQSTGE